MSLLPHYDFAMILLDVQMPGMDGFETASHIRETHGCGDIPIIFVTAINKDDSYVMHGYDVGAVDYLFKPFEPSLLKAKVAVFVDLYTKNRQLREQAGLIGQIREREREHERTRMELESLRRYQNLANAIPHLLWKTDAFGALLYCNSGWRSYTGTDLLDSADNKWRDSIEPDDLKHLLKIWLDAMKTGSSFDMECRIMRFDGVWRWHWLKAVPEKDEQSSVISWIGTCTDIHDRKLFEQSSIEARELAESANKAKTYFLANMSHEIRTPLSAILGFSELLLQEDQDAAERLKYVSVIRNNGKQLLKIIDEVLDISKIEAGRLEVESVEIDTPAFFHEIFLSFRLKAQEKGLAFSMIPLNAFPKKIYTDPVRLRQILANIISNAIKFTNEGRVDAQVEWRASRNSEPAKFVIDVSDTGVGIDEQSVSKLFNAFVQGDPSTTRRFGGTGLGLALSRRLARALGGDIRILSTSSKGSTFRIEVAIPLYSEESFTLSFSDSEQAEISIPSNHKVLDKTIHVLLAEDVVENQVLISRLLGEAGIEVDVASNGIEAIEMAKSHDYDVVLMDIQMPDLDGYQATLSLRQDGYQRPIIALTAHALTEERQRCLSVGCNDHLTKPIDRFALLESVNRYARSTLEQAASCKRIEA